MNQCLAQLQLASLPRKPVRTRSCRRWLPAISVVLLALSACEKNNPGDATDARIDGPPTGCNADPGKCTGATAVCDTTNDVCAVATPKVIITNLSRNATRTPPRGSILRNSRRRAPIGRT